MRFRESDDINVNWTRHMVKHAYDRQERYLISYENQYSIGQPTLSCLKKRLSKWPGAVSATRKKGMSQKHKWHQISQH